MWGAWHRAKKYGRNYPERRQICRTPPCGTPVQIVDIEVGALVLPSAAALAAAAKPASRRADAEFAATAGAAAGLGAPIAHDPVAGKAARQQRAAAQQVLAATTALEHVVVAAAQAQVIAARVALPVRSAARAGGVVARCAGDDLVAEHRVEVGAVDRGANEGGAVVVALGAEDACRRDYKINNWP